MACCVWPALAVQVAQGRASRLQVMRRLARKRALRAAKSPLSDPLTAMLLCLSIPQALEVDALLAGGAAVAAGGVRTVNSRGVVHFDVVALKDEMLKR